MKRIGTRLACAIRTRVLPLTTRITILLLESPLPFSALPLDVLGCRGRIPSRKTRNSCSTETELTVGSPCGS
jgi:hypothetical protein